MLCRSFQKGDEDDDEDGESDVVNTLRFKTPPRLVKPNKRPMASHDDDDDFVSVISARTQERLVNPSSARSSHLKRKKKKKRKHHRQQPQLIVSPAIEPEILVAASADSNQTDYIRKLLTNLSVITGHKFDLDATGSPSGTVAPPAIDCQQKKEVSSDHTKWMDWFVETSGMEGIKANLEGSKPKSKLVCKKTASTPSATGKTASRPANGSDPLSTKGIVVRKKRKSTPCVRRKIDHIITPEEVTDEMLAKVATKPKEKIHDQENGTSCHQCRQKTSDIKTICRSGKCVGLRGFFCGPCLRTRYGEDACLALRDPNWECPVCRGICNCSLCRKAYGHQAVGQIAQRLNKLGYDSVKDYLNKTAGTSTQTCKSVSFSSGGKTDVPSAMDDDNDTRETISPNLHDDYDVDIEHVKIEETPEREAGYESDMEEE